MALNYSKNAILEGIVDYYCLVCEIYIKSKGERDVHIVQNDHVKLLNATQYVKGFEEDGIKKINNKYFCELCNRLLSSLVRIRLHVVEPMHIEKKTICPMKRIGNFVVALDEIVINEQSWHSFCDSSCAICSIEFDDEEKHKMDLNHIINLIQTKVEFDKEKNVYRKIDCELFQCLTCNMVLALNTVTSHFNELEHKNKLQACLDAIHSISNIDAKNESEKKENKKIYDKTNTGTQQCNIIKEQTETNSIKPKNLEGKNSNGNILESAVQFAKNGININFESSVAVCKKCSVDIDFTVDAIKHHIVEHNKKHKKKEHESFSAHNELIDRKDSKSMTPEDLKQDDSSAREITIRKEDTKYTTEDSNNAKVDKKGTKEDSKDTKVYKKEDSKDIKVDKKEDSNNTKVDKKKDSKDTKVDKKEDSKNTKVVKKEDSKNTKVDKKEIFYPKCVTESPKPKEAQNVQPQSKKTGLQKTLTANFIKNITCMADNIFMDIIINDKICINFLSLGFMMPGNGTLKCGICGVAVDNYHNHFINSCKFKGVLDCAMVITQMELEFIREIPSGEYHCGYCNILVPSWDEMETHIKTSSHTESKNSACWRLQTYKQQLANGAIASARFELDKMQTIFNLYSL